MVYVSGASSIPYIKELPDGGINLVIELNENTTNTVYTEVNSTGEFTMKNAWISGTQTQAIVYKNNKESTILSIRFTMGGFFALTKIPVTEISHVCIEAELLLGNSFKHFYQSLINAVDVTEIFKFSEQYFLRYAIDDTFESSVMKFVDTHIDKPIDWLIHKSGYSQKHVIHLIKKHTGFSPKYLQRLDRFQRVVKAIQAQKNKPDWAAIIYEFDYYDQAHFIKEFSHFSGIKPTEYFNSQQENDENQLVADMILRPPSSP